MKKILGMLSCCALVSVSMASDAPDPKAALNGFFAGAGLNFGSYRATADEVGCEWDVKTKDHEIKFAAYAVGWESLFVDYFKFPADKAHCTVNAGNLVVGVNGAVEGRKICLSKNKANKPGASLVFGWGQFVGDLYYGASLAFDITGNKSEELDNSVGIVKLSSMKLKSKGFKPSLAFMVGQYFKAIDALVYLKGGLAYSGAELKSNFGSVKLNSVAPVLGIGAKKIVSNNIAVCCEMDYTFEASKKGRVSETVERSQEAVAGLYRINAFNGNFAFSKDMKLRNRGYNIRLFATIGF